MKNITKIVTSALMTLVLLSMVFPVQALGKNTKPNPNFKNSAAYIERSHRPYYGNNAVVDSYLLDGINYSTDAVSQQIVEIVPQDIQYKTDATYSQDDLKRQSEKLVSDFLGNNVDLSTLSFSLGKKEGTYFFRWEDATKKLDDGTLSFIQVGLSANGDFLNLINTLPFGNASTISPNSGSGQPASVPISPMIGPFSDVYANGGAYWTKVSGSMTSRTGGYYYLYPSGCSGTFCSQFYTAPASGYGGTIGKWTARTNTNTKASVFIPSTYASSTLSYCAYSNGGSCVITVVNQNVWYNTWVSITPSTFISGIKYVSMENLAVVGTTTAWDECWVYNP